MPGPFVPLAGLALRTLAAKKLKDVATEAAERAAKREAKPKRSAAKQRMVDLEAREAQAKVRQAAQKKKKK